MVYFMASFEQARRLCAPGLVHGALGLSEISRMCVQSRAHQGLTKQARSGVKRELSQGLKGPGASFAQNQHRWWARQNLAGPGSRGACFSHCPGLLATGRRSVHAQCMLRTCNLMISHKAHGLGFNSRLPFDLHQWAVSSLKDNARKSC